MAYFVDPNGRILGNDFRPLPDGQEGLGSIFHVPNADSASIDVDVKTGPIDSIHDLVAAAEHHGFEKSSGYGGGNLFLNLYDDPKTNYKLPSPPPYWSGDPRQVTETSGGSTYRTSCVYCWAIVNDKERPKGFTLAQLHKAALQGCEVCDGIQKAVSVFAQLLFFGYDERKVRVRQDENQPSRLLSQTRKVSVYFEEYDGETILLQFSDQRKLTR
jgi:hypothetical protein